MMCVFGGGGGGGTAVADTPVSKGPSDQTTPTREENYRSAQEARDPLGRTGKNKNKARVRSGGSGTLLTAGMVDDSGKKTLLGA